MPLNRYYGGHGATVMKEMVAKYGEKKAKEVFYATVNKQKKKDVIKRAAGKVKRKKSS